MLSGVRRTFQCNKQQLAVGDVLWCKVVPGLKDSGTSVYIHLWEQLSTVSTAVGLLTESETYVEVSISQ